MVENEATCPTCKKVTPGHGDERHGQIAIFRSDLYVNDAKCLRTIAEISKDWREIGRASLAKHSIAEFHPISLEELKQIRDVNAFMLIADCGGNLVRTRLVNAEGATFLNPPPSDHRCESCHELAGPLRKRFQTSAVDGANIPVWLCCSCEMKLREKRGVRF